MQYLMPRFPRPLPSKEVKWNSRSSMTASPFINPSMAPTSCIYKTRALLCLFQVACTTWSRKVFGMCPPARMVPGRYPITGRNRWIRSCPLHRFTTPSMCMFMTAPQVWSMLAIPRVTPAVMSIEIPFSTAPAGTTGPGFPPTIITRVSAPGVLMSATTRGVVGILA